MSLHSPPPIRTGPTSGRDCGENRVRPRLHPPTRRGPASRSTHRRSQEVVTSIQCRRQRQHNSLSFLSDTEGKGLPGTVPGPGPTTDGNRNSSCYGPARQFSYSPQTGEGRRRTSTPFVFGPTPSRVIRTGKVRGSPGVRHSRHPWGHEV